MSLDNRNRKIFLICFFAWLLVASWMVIIFLLSNQPSNESDALSMGLLKKIMDIFSINLTDHAIRKTAHTFEYFLLAALIFTASRWTWHRSRPFLTFFAALIYSAGDEFHQHFIPGRAPRFSDVCIDSAGAIAGILFCLAAVTIFNKLKRRREQCEEKPIK